VSVSEIAAVQATPRRFLELIIKELKQAGLVHAHRGVRGGYTLASPPQEISVGAVIQLIDGPQRPVDCESCGGKEYCPLTGQCAWNGLWRHVHDTVQEIYHATTFAQLLEGRFAAAPVSD